MNKNEKLLNSFYQYCVEHPEMRFFQCLRNWLLDLGFNAPFVLTAKRKYSENGAVWVDIQDTFSWEDVPLHAGKKSRLPHSTGE